MLVIFLLVLLFLSRCAGTSSAAAQPRALTGKSALETAACQELEIWYNLSLSWMSVRPSLTYFCYPV